MSEIIQVRHFIYSHLYVYIGHSITCGVRHLVNDIALCLSPKSPKNP